MRNIGKKTSKSIDGNECDFSTSLPTSWTRERSGGKRDGTEENLVQSWQKSGRDAVRKNPFRDGDPTKCLPRLNEGKTPGNKMNVQKK